MPIEFWCMVGIYAAVVLGGGVLTIFAEARLSSKRVKQCAGLYINMNTVRGVMLAITVIGMLAGICGCMVVHRNVYSNGHVVALLAFLICCLLISLALLFLVAPVTKCIVKRRGVAVIDTCGSDPFGA